MAQRIKMVKYLDSYHTSNLDIRPVDREQIRTIAEIMLDSYIDTPEYEGETLEDTIKEISMVFRGYYGKFLTDASFLAYDEDGDMVSGLFVCEFKNEPTLTYLFTRKNSQGLGYASALIQTAQTALLSMGYHRIYLYVSKSNRAACQLYKNQGFVQIPFNTTPVDRALLQEVRERELNFIPIKDEDEIAKLIDPEIRIHSRKPQT